MPGFALAGGAVAGCRMPGASLPGEAPDGALPRLFADDVVPCCVVTGCAGPGSASCCAVSSAVLGPVTTSGEGASAAVVLSAATTGTDAWDAIWSEAEAEAEVAAEVADGVGTGPAAPAVRATTISVPAVASSSAVEVSSRSVDGVRSAVSVRRSGSADSARARRSAGPAGPVGPVGSVGSVGSVDSVRPRPLGPVGAALSTVDVVGAAFRSRPAMFGPGGVPIHRRPGSIGARRRSAVPDRCGSDELGQNSAEGLDGTGGRPVGTRRTFCGGGDLSSPEPLDSVRGGCHASSFQ